MSSIETLYGEISSEVFASLKDLRLVAFDIDGVFSDGRLYMGNQGEELKAFHTLDGYGVKALMKIGIEVAVITGRQSAIVENRMKSLGVRHVIQGQEDKITALEKLQKQLQLGKQQTASVGDDMPDLGMFELSQVKFSVHNGHPYVQRLADYVTTRSGGHGAVREICDLILQAQGKLDMIHGSST